MIYVAAGISAIGANYSTIGTTAAILAVLCPHCTALHVTGGLSILLIDPPIRSFAQRAVAGICHWELSVLVHRCERHQYIHTRVLDMAHAVCPEQCDSGYSFRCAILTVFSTTVAASIYSVVASIQVHPCISCVVSACRVPAD